MKKVLSLIFVLSSFVAFSQSTTFQGTPNTKLVSRGFNVVDSGLILTAKDTTAWFGLKSDFVRKASNGKMYFFDGTKYTELGGGSTAQTLQSVTDQGNVTNNAIQVTGIGNLADTPSASIVYIGGNGGLIVNTGDSEAGATFSTGEFSIFEGDNRLSASLANATPFTFQTTGGDFGRVRGAAATTNNDFVIKSQLDSVAGNSSIPSLQQVTGVDSVTTHQTTFAQMTVNDTAISKFSGVRGALGAVNIVRQMRNRNQDYWGFSDISQSYGDVDTQTNVGGYASSNSQPEFYNVKNVDHISNFQGNTWLTNSQVSYTEGLTICGFLTNSTIGQWNGAVVEFPVEIGGGGSSTIGEGFAYRVWNKGAPNGPYRKWAFYSDDPNYEGMFGGKMFMSGLTSATVGDNDKMLVVDTVSGEVKKVDIGGANLANTNLTQTEYYRNYDGGGNGVLDFNGLESFNVSANMGSRLVVSDCVGECEQGVNLYSTSGMAIEADGSISITAQSGVLVSTNGIGAALSTANLTSLRSFEFQDMHGEIETLDPTAPSISQTGGDAVTSVSLDSGSTSKFGRVLVTNNTPGILHDVEITITYSQPFPNASFGVISAGSAVSANLLQTTSVYTESSASTFKIIFPSVLINGSTPIPFNYIINGN